MYVRRTPLALLAALALALPGIASAQARGGGPRPQMGALIGLEDGDGDTGLSLRLDGEFDYQALAPAVRLSFVGSLGYSRWSYNPGFFSDLDATLNIFKFIPAARFSFGRSPFIRPYFDAGLGLYYASFSVETRDAFGRVYRSTDSDMSLMMRFAGGLLFHVSPGLSLGGEVGLTPYFGDVDDNTFSLLFAATFRL
jgi:hypothetical protein